MVIARKLKAFLDEEKVPYHVLRHHERYTSQEIAEALHLPGQMLAKVVMVKAQGKLQMAVLPANLRVDVAAFGAEAVLATEEEFKGAFPDCEVGAMPPFGNLYDMQVYVDDTIAGDDEIVFNAGLHTELVRMKYADFKRLAEPKVGKFGAPR